jgi:hypothetical protein
MIQFYSTCSRAVHRYTSSLPRPCCCFLPPEFRAQLVWVLLHHVLVNHLTTIPHPSRPQSFSRPHDAILFLAADLIHSLKLYISYLTTMFEGTRKFLRRHRTNLVVGVGIVGAGYLVMQYIGNKLSEARNRMMNDRVARRSRITPNIKFHIFSDSTSYFLSFENSDAKKIRDSINRRFQQNQEDCTYTVQALLPTATESILKEFPVESLTHELQQKKAARMAKSSAASMTDAGSDTTTPASPNALKEDDNQSLKSFASESFSAIQGEKPGVQRPLRGSSRAKQNCSCGMKSKSAVCLPFTLFFVFKN